MGKKKKRVVGGATSDGAKPQAWREWRGGGCEGGARQWGLGGGTNGGVSAADLPTLLQEAAYVITAAMGFQKVSKPVFSGAASWLILIASSSEQDCERGKDVRFLLKMRQQKHEGVIRGLGQPHTPGTAMVTSVNNISNNLGEKPGDNGGFLA